MTMSKPERLEATFRGEAVALWRHWPGPVLVTLGPLAQGQRVQDKCDDQRAEDLAAAHLAFQQQYDFDFIKVTPASSFCLEDWGVETCYRGNNEGSREYLRRPVQSPDDWWSLPVLDPQQGKHPSGAGGGGEMRTTQPTLALGLRIAVRRLF